VSFVLGFELIPTGIITILAVGVAGRPQTTKNRRTSTYSCREIERKG
jgi:hypothetical protein